jgi:hypothetical protein
MMGRAWDRFTAWLLPIGVLRLTSGWEVWTLTPIPVWEPPEWSTRLLEGITLALVVAADLMLVAITLAAGRDLGWW